MSAQQKTAKSDANNISSRSSRQRAHIDQRAPVAEVGTDAAQIRRTDAVPTERQPADILALQRRYGNLAVRSLFRAGSRRPTVHARPQTDTIIQRTPVKLGKVREQTELYKESSPTAKVIHEVDTSRILTWVYDVYHHNTDWTRVKYRSKSNSQHQGFIRAEAFKTLKTVDDSRIGHITSSKAKLFNEYGSEVFKLRLGDLYEIIDFGEAGKDPNNPIKDYHYVRFPAFGVRGYLKASKHHERMLKQERKAKQRRAERGINESVSFVGPNKTRTPDRQHGAVTGHSRAESLVPLGMRAGYGAMGSLVAPEHVTFTGDEKSFFAQQFAASGKTTRVLAGRLMRLRNVNKDVEQAEIYDRRKLIRKQMYGDNKWGQRFKKLYDASRIIGTVGALSSLAALLFSLIALFPPAAPIAVPIATVASFIAIIVNMVQAVLKMILMGRNIYRLQSLPKAERRGAGKQLIRDTLGLFVAVVGAVVGGAVGGDLTEIASLGGGEAYGGADIGGVAGQKESVTQEGISMGSEAGAAVLAGFAQGPLAKGEERDWQTHRQSGQDVIQRQTDAPTAPQEDERARLAELQEQLAIEEAKAQANLEALQQVGTEEHTRAQEDLQNQEEADAILARTEQGLSGQDAEAVAHAKKQLKGKAKKHLTGERPAAQKLERATTRLSSQAASAPDAPAADAPPISEEKAAEVNQTLTRQTSSAGIDLNVTEGAEEQEKSKKTSNKFVRFLKKKTTKLMTKAKTKVVNVVTQIPPVKQAVNEMQAGIEENEGALAEMQEQASLAEKLRAKIVEGQSAL